MSYWDFLVDRQDLRRSRVLNLAVPPTPAEGEVLLGVESFALTANNVTYGLIGDQAGYWRFFPAPAPFGRIPAWGYARVVQSTASGVPEGTRLFGYWPMSTHLTARLEKRGAGFAEISPHRSGLPGIYNSYQSVGEPSEGDDWRSLLQPLFLTSFLLDDYLTEARAATLVLSSASSKTALEAFVGQCDWLSLQRHVGAAALEAVYGEVLGGTANPLEGHIVRPV